MQRVATISEKSLWHQALCLCESYDFYHTWDFHALSQINGEGTPVLYKMECGTGGLLVPLLSRVIPGSSHKDVTSVYGYPSPLIYGNVADADIMVMWENLLRFLEGNGYISLFTRLHPLLTPRLLVEQYGSFCGKVVYLDLTLSEEEQLAGYRKRCLTSIRALKRKEVICFQINDNDGLQNFIKIYEDTMKYVKATKYYFFSKKYYHDLFEANNFDTRIYCCEYEQKQICSGLFIFCGDIVQYHLGGTDPEFYHLSPTKLMFDQVRKDACNEGKKYLVLGGGVGASEDSLFRFKSSFSKTTADFYVIKKILNQDIYDGLSLNVMDKSGFFPKYRATR